jgi:type IX secretion system PorP/SprF family membrane protein
MSKWISIALCFLLSLASGYLYAQDPHFTQFFNAGQQYNPARVGDFFGDVRASTHYRRQWANAGSGYGTRAADIQSKFLHKKQTNYLGGGVFVLSDQAGQAQIRTLQILGSIAYHLKLSSKDFVSAGFQGGYLSRRMDVTGLAWDAQYDGFEYNPALDPNENFGTNADRGFDMALGVHWIRKTRKYNFSAGYSSRHFGQNQTILAGGRDRLPIRQVLSGSAETSRGMIRLRTDVLIQRQRGAMQYNVGARAEYRVGDDSKYTDVNKSSALMAGLYYRYGDALSPMIGAEWKRTLSLFISYDFPISRVTRTVTFLGGPEITLIYQGAFGEKRKLVD